MKFTLNIYDKKKVVKTYEADAYDLMFGTLEDFVAAIDEGFFSENVSNADFAKMGVMLLKNSMDQIKPLIMDVFDGLTEEEIRNTKTSELLAVILAIAKYSFAEIKGISSGKKL